MIEAKPVLFVSLQDNAVWYCDETSVKMRALSILASAQGDVPFV